MEEFLLNDALSELDVLINSSKGALVSEIDKAIFKVANFNNPASIGPLLSSLRDDALYDEGMYSLIHAAEAFDDEVYVEKLLEVLPVLVSKSPAWASVVLIRVVNNDAARTCLTRRVKQASEAVKESLLWLIGGINKEDPSFISKTMAPMLAATTR